MKKAIVAGATGLVGKELLYLLFKSEQYSKVTAMLRKQIPISDSKLQQQIIDFNKLSAYENIFENADAVFCCLGTTMKNAGSKEAFRKVDYEYALELAKISEKKGVKQFLIISAMGADATSSIFYNKVKGELENELKKLSILSVTVVRPSLLFGNRQEVRVGERIGILFARLLGFLFIGPLKKYKAIEAEKVARGLLNYSLDESKGFRIVESDELQKFTSHVKLPQQALR